MKKNTVSIVIPAYNAENRIKNLLSSVASQNTNNTYNLKIIVYSDTSSDTTVKKAKSISIKNTAIIDGKIRKGFAGVVKKFVEKNKSDVLIFLNDDITISDPNFINKILKGFIKKNAGFSCIDIKPLTTKTFIEKANYSSFKSYRKMAYSYRKGSNIFTCDGKVMILSKKFTESLTLPEDSRKMGNVDCYLYFECLRKNLKYSCINTVTAYFAFPSTLSDYIKWTGRNNSNHFFLKDTFGKIVEKEYSKPKNFYYYSLKEFLSNPFGCLFVFALRTAVNRHSKKTAHNFNAMWDTINTTKILSRS